jgi:hypothetical protein
VDALPELRRVGASAVGRIVAESAETGNPKSRVACGFVGAGIDDRARDSIHLDGSKGKS